MAARTGSKITTNHAEIRSWALARNGKPALTSRPEVGDDRAGLCIFFSGHRSEGLQDEISWDKWLKKFDESGLAFLYQEHTAGGEKSTFNKLVRRESVDEVEAAVGGKGRSVSHKRQGSEPLASPPAEARRSATASTVARKVGKKSVGTGKKVIADEESPPSRSMSRTLRKSTSHRSVKSTSRIQQPD